MTSPRGIRNRNPGNIVVSGWTQRQSGYTGPEPQGRFATFDTMARGVEALLRLLLVYRDQHGLKTVRGIINRWAPPQENDTSSYSLSVARALHVDLDDDLPADAETYTGLAMAIVSHENGRDAARAVTDEDYAQAARNVFPQAPAVSPTDDADAAGSPPAAPPPPAAGPTPAFPRGSGDDPFPAFPFPYSEPPMGPLAIGLQLLPEILSMAPAIVRLFGKSDNAERNAKALEVIGPKIAPIVYEAGRKALDQPRANEQAVVEGLRNDAEARKRFNAELAMQYEQLLPLMDKAVDLAIRGQEADDASRDKASGRAKSDTAIAEATPLLIRSALGLLFFIIVLLVGVMGLQTWLTSDHKYDPQLLILFVAIAGQVVGVVVTIFAYRFGSSAGSKASGDAVRAIAEGRR